ncbi:hypothetical protein TCAL_05485, partial [Tigriopus californicus]
EKLKRKLLELENPSFKTVKQKILAYEKAIFAVTTPLTIPLTCMAEVNKVTSQSQQKGNNKPKSGKARLWAELDGRCTCCGAKEHKAAQCPRKLSVCNKCGRQGHLRPACMSGVPYPKRGKAPSTSARASQVIKSTLFDEHSGEPETVGQNPFEYEESDFVSYVRAMEALQSASGSRATLRINVHIRSHRNVQFYIKPIPDTGATRTMLSLDLVQRHGLDMESTHDTVRAANGDQMSVAGRVVLELTVNGRTAYVDCLVSACMCNCMLVSWHDLQNLGIISSTFPSAASEEVNAAAEASSKIKEMTQDLRKQFHDVLSDSLAPDQRVVGEPIHIKLAEDAVPYHANTSRPIPFHYRKEADATIKRLLHSGRISRVEEATTWCARAHFVPNEGGKAGLRLWLDIHDKAFRQAKKLLTSSLLVKQFDEKLETFLLSDASRLHGLEPVIPAQVLVDAIVEAPPGELTASILCLFKVIDKVRTCQLENQENNRQSYNNKVKLMPLQEGNWVFKYRANDPSESGISRKTAVYQDRPYQVQELLNNRQVKLRKAITGKNSKSTTITEILQTPYAWTIAKATRVPKTKTVTETVFEPVHYPSLNQVPHHAPTSEEQAEMEQPKESQLEDVENRKSSEETDPDQEMDAEELFTNREFIRQPAVKRRASTFNDSFTPTKPEAKRTALEPEQATNKDDDFSNTMANIIFNNVNL